jgi:hypothetical protein
MRTSGRGRGRRRRSMMVGVVHIPGWIKAEFVRRAYDSWPELADVLAVPPWDRHRWARGAEARELWDWLVVRHRLDELRAACRLAGRPDLAGLLTGPWPEASRPAAAAPPMMVPVLNRVRIPRPGLHQEVIAAFRRGVEPAVAVTAAVRGTGGFGKTTLAEMICADPEVQRAFPGGVLWVEVGDAPEGRIPMKINEVLRVLAAGSRSTGDPRRAAAELAEALGDRPTLLVVDDVWTTGQLAPFLTGAPSCVRLITTRNALSLPRGTRAVPVEAMLPGEARDLLLHNVPAPTSPEPVDRLLAMTGRWPLLLGLINGVLDRLVQQDNSTDDALADVELRLREAGPLAFDSDRPEATRREAVTTTLRASLQFLRPEDRLRFEELAVFPAHAPIPLPVLGRWWASTAGLTEAQVRRLCGLLADHSLVLRYQLNPPQIHLHDVVLESLRGLVGRQRLDRMLAQYVDQPGTQAPVDFDDDDED